MELPRPVAAVRAVVRGVATKHRLRERRRRKTSRPTSAIAAAAALMTSSWQRGAIRAAARSGPSSIVPRISPASLKKRPSNETRVDCDSTLSKLPCWTTRSTGRTFVMLADDDESGARAGIAVIFERDRHAARIAAELEFTDPLVLEIALDRRASRRRFDLRGPHLPEREFGHVAGLPHFARHGCRPQSRCASKSGGPVRRAAERGDDVEGHVGVGHGEIRQRCALDAEPRDDDRSRPAAGALLREIHNQLQLPTRDLDPALPTALRGSCGTARKGRKADDESDQRAAHEQSPE